MGWSVFSVSQKRRWRLPHQSEIRYESDRMGFRVRYIDNQLCLSNAAKELEHLFAYRVKSPSVDLIYIELFSTLRVALSGKIS